jgi:hypothetical protein
MFIIKYIKNTYKNYNKRKMEKKEKNDKELSLITESYLEDDKYIFCDNKQDEFSYKNILKKNIK